MLDSVSPILFDFSRIWSQTNLLLVQRWPHDCRVFQTCLMSPTIVENLPSWFETKLPKLSNQLVESLLKLFVTVIFIIFFLFVTVINHCQLRYLVVLKYVSALCSLGIQRVFFLHRPLKIRYFFFLSWSMPTSYF